MYRWWCSCSQQYIVYNVDSLDFLFCRSYCFLEQIDFNLRQAYNQAAMEALSAAKAQKIQDEKSDSDDEVQFIEATFDPTLVKRRITPASASQPPVSSSPTKPAYVLLQNSILHNAFHSLSVNKLLTYQHCCFHCENVYDSLQSTSLYFRPPSLSKETIVVQQTQKERPTLDVLRKALAATINKQFVPPGSADQVYRLILSEAQFSNFWIIICLELLFSLH